MTKHHDFPKGTVVGYFILSKPTKFTKTYECAAWYKDIEVPAGRYPIVTGLEPWEDQWKSHAFCVALPGKVTSSCFDSLWGGNLIPGGAKRDTHVGEDETYHLSYSGFGIMKVEGWGATVEILPDFQPLMVCHGLYNKYNWSTQCDEPDYASPMLRLDLGLSKTKYRTNLKAVDGVWLIFIVNIENGAIVSYHGMGTDLRPVFAALGVEI